MNNKLFILGFDGATLDIIEPLMAEGYLPSFKKLSETGIKGRLKSTIPPQSSVAWPVMMTGTGPGRTGIFAFWQNLAGSWEHPLIHSGAIKSPTIFDYLNALGGDGVSFNVPISYPPAENPGTIVTGLLSPSVEAGITKPHSLLLELIARGLRPPLEMELLGMVGSSPGVSILEKLHENLRKREKIMYYLMEEKPWDIFMSVFTISDRIQHFFWHAMDENHPGYSREINEKYGEAIKNCYISLDAILGRLMDKLGDIPIVVLSDHGFGPKIKNIFLNKWLEEKGYLHLKKKIRRYRLIRFGKRLRLVPKQPREIIDWGKTRAYSNWIGSQEGIYVNLKGREPEGIVEKGSDYETLVTDIKRELMQLKDPDTGKNAVDWVLRGDELYSGPYKDLAPDLVMTFSDHAIMPAPGLEEKSVFRSTADSTFTGRQEGESGQHRDHGILFVRGEGVQKGSTIDDVSLQDILPLVFYMMQLPIPSGLDGKLPERIFSTEYFEEYSPEYKLILPERQVPQGENVEPISENDDERVKERLKGLGYIE